jgi:hypothetical protein
MAIENERLKTELAIATESLGNVKADFESLRNAASSEVGLPTKAATIPPAAAPQGAPAETDLELPTFLDRRLTDGLSETETREFVSVTAMWQASDLRRALLNTSPTVRDRFQTMVLGSATARDN